MKKYLFKNLIIICAGCFVLISQTTEKNNFQNQNLIEAQEKLRTQNQQTLTEKLLLMDQLIHLNIMLVRLM